MFSNTTTISQISYKIILLLLIFTITKTNKLVYISKSTNCTITFSTNINNTNNNNTDLKLQKCIRKQCLRNLIDGHCTNLQAYQFQQQKCYRQCCGANQFDILQCTQYNQKRFAHEQKSTTRLVLILTMCLLGVMIAIIVFAVIYLKCCSKQVKPVTYNYQKQLKWKQCQFKCQKHCIKCKQSGAFITLTCGIFYHLKCLGNNQGWKCQHCQKNIYKIKLYCPVCLKRSIIIRAMNYQELDQKIVEFYNFHPEKCFQIFSQETDTQRKFTIIPNDE